MTARVHAILQARMSSRRLPGKVLAEVAGRPMILRQLDRINRSKMVDRLTVATSSDASDDPLCDVLDSQGVDYSRGDLENVAERFGDVIRRHNPINVVRLTADCPLADWDVIDQVVEAHLLFGADYTSNTLHRTFPKGLDVEAFKAPAFLRLIAGGLSSEEQEHVTLGFFRENFEGSLHSVTREPSLAHLRWTVDYQTDLDFVRDVYSEFRGEDYVFGFTQILGLNRNSAPEV